MTDQNEYTENPTWDVTSICPMDILFGFPLGSTQNNPESNSILKKMSELQSNIKVDITESIRASEILKGSEYVSTENDVSTIKLFSWYETFENENGKNQSEKEFLASRIRGSRSDDLGYDGSP